MVHALPVFLVQPQTTAVTLTEELMLVRALLRAFHRLTQSSSAECSGDLQGTIFTSFVSDIVWPFLATRCYLWVYWCVTLQYHYCLGARTALCNKRVSLGFQHLSDLSHSPRTAKNIPFNAVNIGHSLCAVSLLIVSSGLWNSSPFWNHKTLTVRQRRIQSV